MTAPHSNAFSVSPGSDYADRTAHTKLGGMGMRVFGFDFDKRPMPPSSEKLADVRRPLVEIASRPSAQTARCSKAISRSISATMAKAALKAASRCIDPGSCRPGSCTVERHQAKRKFNPPDGTTGSPSRRNPQPSSPRSMARERPTSGLASVWCGRKYTDLQGYPSPQSRSQ